MYVSMLLLLLLLLSHFSRVRPLATPWTAPYQAPPSMGFSRQQYWNGVPLPSPRTSVQWTDFTLLQGHVQGESQRFSGLCEAGARSFILLIHTGSLSFQREACSLFFWIKPYTVLPEGKCWAAIPVFLPAVGMKKPSGRAGASCRRKSFLIPLF